MIHKSISYIKFLWNSVNAHGVHSPFVFDLVTKCFYQKAKDKHGLLYRLVYYFRPEIVLLKGDDIKIAAKEITLAAEELNIPVGINPNIQQPATDNRQLIFISHKQKAAIQTSFEQLLPTVKNDTFWIVNHIHSSPQMEKIWSMIKSLPQVTVTIDTYHYGMIFFRCEQEKEHFVIRPYKSVFLDAVLGIRTLWGLLS